MIHADPSVRAKYEQACGVDVEVRPIVRAGLSSEYVRLAAEVGGIRGLAKRYPPAHDLDSYEAILLVTYSAGYAYARTLQKADRDLLDGLVLLDSAHAAVGADGAPAGLGWLVLWAEEARAGRKVLSLGHTDVPTHGYASTTAVARELARLSGGELGEFTIRAFDTRPPHEAKQEHGAALTLWGPAFVADAVDRVRRMLGRRDTDPAPPPELEPDLPARRLGLRIADAAREYLGRGVVEVPGPASNAQISSLLYPCRRGGSPVAGILDATGDRILGDAPPDSIAWCAAIRSFLVFLAGYWTGDADRRACPHGYRCSVRELVEDARARKTLRPADGSYLPREGDAAVWKRNGQNPLEGGEGHVATVVVGGQRFVTIGGNERDALRESGHMVGELDLVAFIAAEAA